MGARWLEQRAGGQVGGEHGAAGTLALPACAEWRRAAQACGGAGGGVGRGGGRDAWPLRSDPGPGNAAGRHELAGPRCRVLPECWGTLEVTAQGIAQPPALPPGDGRHPTSCRALWRLSQGRGVPGTGKVLLLWWPGPKRPPGGVLATLLRPRHPAPARRCRGPRRAGHTTFLDPGTRRTSPMASASVSPFGLLHRQSFQEGEGRARERQAPRPLSNVHSRVQGPPLRGQHRSPSQNWGAEPGA